MQEGFFALPERLPQPPRPATMDPLSYRLEIADDGRRHHVDWDDNAAAPMTLTELVGLLSDVEGWRDAGWEEWH